MVFTLFWIDFFVKERLFGFGIMSFCGEECSNSLFSIYYAKKSLSLQLFYFKILG